MEKLFLTGISVVVASLLAWGGVSLYRRAQKRGEQAGCLCLLCFLAAAGVALFAVKQILEVAPREFMGLVLGSVGGAMLFRSHRFFKRAIIVSGVVTGYKEEEDIEWKNFRERAAFHGKNLPEKRPELSSGPRMTYAPIVQFEFDGAIRQVTGTVYSSAKPKTGVVMKVGVNPQNIADARLYQKSNGVLAWVFLTVGLVLFIAALYGHITAGILSPR